MMEKYLKERVEDQIIWYSNKASNYKRKYLGTSYIILVSSAAIPLLVGFDFIKRDSLDLILSLLGFLITILSGVMTFNKFQEKWQKYRTTSETLKHERMLYLYNSGVYDGQVDVDKLFVQRIEKLISEENSLWCDFVK